MGLKIMLSEASQSPKAKYIFFLKCRIDLRFNHFKSCVGECVCMWVCANEEQEAGVTGRCEPPVWVLGRELGSSPANVKS